VKRCVIIGGVRLPIIAGGAILTSGRAAKLVAQITSLSIRAIAGDDVITEQEAIFPVTIDIDAPGAPNGVPVTVTVTGPDGTAITLPGTVSNEAVSVTLDSSAIGTLSVGTVSVVATSDTVSDTRQVTKAAPPPSIQLDEIAGNGVIDANEAQAPLDIVANLTNVADGTFVQFNFSGGTSISRVVQAVNSVAVLTLSVAEITAIAADTTTSVRAIVAGADDDVALFQREGTTAQSSFAVEIDGLTFDTADESEIVARLAFGKEALESEARPPVDATTEWRIKGTAGWWDHVAGAPYANHSQRLPAKVASTSNPPTTTGPYLTRGQAYEYRTTITDGTQTATTPITEFTVPAAPSSGGGSSGGGSGAWQPDSFKPLPSEGNGWTILHADPTGSIVTGYDQTSKQQLASGRITPNNSPDRYPAFRHRVNSGDIVHPVSSDSPFIPVTLSNYTYALMRYHMFLDSTHPFGGHDGKYMLFNVGRGMVSWRWGTSDTDAVGTGGGGCNSMHPGRTVSGGSPSSRPASHNGVRLLGSHTENGTLQNSGNKYYGSSIGSGIVPPTGRWVPVDILCRKNDGWTLYVDGVRYGRSTNKTPVTNWNACKALWYRVRLMHGGKPEQLQAVRTNLEWYGGFFVAVA